MANDSSAAQELLRDAFTRLSEHVADLTDAHLKALLRLRGGGASLVANCGYGMGYSVLDVLNMVTRVHGHTFKIGMAPRRPGDAASVVADSSLARKELAWTPIYNCMETIVRSSLDWENYLGQRQNGDLESTRKALAASF